MPANQLLRTGDTLAKMSGLRKPGTGEVWTCNYSRWKADCSTWGARAIPLHSLASRVHRELNFQVAASESFSDLPPTLGGEETKEPSKKSRKETQC